MKRYILTMLLAIAAVFAHADNSLWKAYMAYHDITRIEQGGKRLYVLASGNLFTYNTADGEVRTFDKCNGLSDCAISHIAWCQQAARLVIVYSNQNIDLMSGRNNDDITNLPDYYRKAMTEDKTINHVCIDGVYAYLSTGFGIVKVNVKNAEVSETYNLHTPVAYSYVESGYLYAAQRGKGIYRAALGTNMMDPANWTYARAYSDIWETPDSKLLDMVKDLDRGGLKYNNFGCLRFYDGRLYTVGGGYTVSQDLHLPGGIQVYDGSNWEVYQDDIDSQLGDGFFEDINAIDVDPRDATTCLSRAARVSTSSATGGLCVTTVMTTAPSRPPIPTTRCMWWCMMSSSTPRAISGRSTASTRRRTSYVWAPTDSGYHSTRNL